MFIPKKKVMRFIVILNNYKMIGWYKINLIYYLLLTKNIMDFVSLFIPKKRTARNNS